MERAFHECNFNTDFAFAKLQSEGAPVPHGRPVPPTIAAIWPKFGLTPVEWEAFDRLLQVSSDVTMVIQTCIACEKNDDSAHALL